MRSGEIICLSEVLARARHVADRIGDAYAWHHLLLAVRDAKMSAALEMAIRACIQEINGRAHTCKV